MFRRVVKTLDAPVLKTTVMMHVWGLFFNFLLKAKYIKHFGYLFLNFVMSYCSIFENFCLIKKNKIFDFLFFS